MTSKNDRRRGLTPYQQKIILERLADLQDERLLFTSAVANAFGLSSSTVTANSEVLGGRSSTPKGGSGASMIFFPDVLMEAVRTQPQNISRPHSIPSEDPASVKPRAQRDDTRIKALEREVENIPDLIAAAEERAFQRAVRYISESLSDTLVIPTPPIGWPNHINIVAARDNEATSGS